jgi:leucine dehydrogenase
VTGVSRALGGSGDPSAATAYGVLHAMKAVAAHLWDNATLEGRHVVINGVGKVGTGLVRHLVEERARVTVADIRREAVDRVITDFGVDAVPHEKAHAVECDVYSPCALGGALNPTTIPELRCAAVVGAANNQLAEPDCADLLSEAGVLYAPDFVVNAGGVINIAGELAPRGYHRERAYAQVRTIFDTVRSVIAAAEANGITTAVAADQLAEERMARLGHVRLIRTFTDDR